MLKILYASSLNLSSVILAQFIFKMSIAAQNRENLIKTFFGSGFYVVQSHRC